MRDPGNEVVSKKCGFDRNDKLYNHVPESVLENENYKLLWDFSIRTGHHIEARRPDLVLVDKSKKSCQIIDLAIPEDSGVIEKKAERVEKYQNLARELRRMWEVKTKVVPIVFGALGTVPLRLKGNLKDIGVDTSITLIQKSALLGSARILRKVLEFPASRGLSRRGKMKRQERDLCRLPTSCFFKTGFV